MNPLNFLKNFGKTSIASAVQSGIDSLAKWDPIGASRAELLEMEKNLDNLGKKVVAAREALSFDDNQLEQINSLFNQRLAAAQLLEKQLENENESSRQDSLNKSLETIIEQLEQQKNELDQRSNSRSEAYCLVQELESAYEAAAAKLKTARDQLSRSERELELAKLDRDKALEMAENARLSSGLSQKADTITSSLDVLHHQASQARQEAEAARLKREVLREKNPDTDDPNIAAALASVSGKPSAPNLSDRLSMLKPVQTKSLPSPEK